MSREYYALSVGFKHFIHKFRSGSSECWPTVA